MFYTRYTIHAIRAARTVQCNKNFYRTAGRPSYKLREVNIQDSLTQRWSLCPEIGCIIVSQVNTLDYIMLTNQVYVDIKESYCPHNSAVKEWGVNAVHLMKNCTHFQMVSMSIFTLHYRAKYDLKVINKS